MTLRLLDISRWQIPNLDLDAARESGFAAVNVQLTGSGGYVSGSWARTYTDKARALGMGVCTYHWLDSTRTGAEHAAVAWRRIAELGGPEQMAHQVDCESDATWPILRDYVTAMQDKLQRQVVIYTGDWWWEHPNRRWPGSTLTPYLWAAPNRGYPGEYPGDDSPEWVAGYGGWANLAVMQYAVRDVAGVRCSLSAFRDPAAWTALTGGSMAWYLNRALTTMRAEVNARWTSRDKTSDGTIGDAAHASRSSDHNPDPDGSVDAWDMDVQLNGVGHAYASDVEFVKAQFEKHPAASYWIHNDRICRRADSFQPRSYPDYLRSKGIDPSGRNTHTQHVHFNSREQYEDSSAPWGILEEDVNLDDVVWTAPAGHPSGVPAGGRDVRDILTALDTRTALLTNANYIKNLIDAQTGVLLPKFAEVLTAISDDPDNPVTLTDEQVTELSGLLVAMLPAPIADAVVDEHGRRLTAPA